MHSRADIVSHRGEPQPSSKRTDIWGQVDEQIRPKVSQKARVSQ